MRTPIVYGVKPCPPALRLFPQGHLVTLAMDDRAGVAVLELSDTAHFNALGSALGRDLRMAVRYLSTQTQLRGAVLQAAGPHFCIGGNPWETHVDAPLASLAADLLEGALCVCSLRETCLPVVGSVHGHVAGGGVALSLNTSYLVAEAATTFEHGNIPRGVCPVAFFSQTLAASVGSAAASSMYLTNARLTAVSALQLGS